MQSWDLSWKDPYSEIIMLFLLHCIKKRLTTFPSPAGMSLAKLSLAGKNLIIPAKGKFGS
jgi:hypothetical protein